MAFLHHRFMRVAYAWPTRGKRYVIYKTGSTKRIATPPEEYRTTATGNMHRKFGEIWLSDF